MSKGLQRIEFSLLSRTMSHKRDDDEWGEFNSPKDFDVSQFCTPPRGCLTVIGVAQVRNLCQCPTSIRVQWCRSVASSMTLRCVDVALRRQSALGSTGRTEPFSPATRLSCERTHIPSIAPARD